MTSISGWAADATSPGNERKTDHADRAAVAAAHTYLGAEAATLEGFSPLPLPAAC